MTVTAEWITRLADDERKRDDARARASEAAARKRSLVAVHGQRLLDELRATIVRDVETFRDQFPGDTAREIVFESARADGGFAVHKSAYPGAVLRIVPHLLDSAVSCEYRFTLANGLPPREDRFELMLTSMDGDDTLRVKHGSTGRVFTGADALSEYLLVPVFTGRPRLTGSA